MPHHPRNMLSPVVGLLTLALLFAPAAATAAKPKPAKSAAKAPKPKPGDKDGPAPDAAADPAGKDAATGKPDNTGEPDKTAKQPAKPARPDPTEALLGVSGQAALVALLHSHFALTGLGHAMRAGALGGQDVAIQAGTLQQNLQGLSQQFGQLAAHPAFDPQLADLWRSLSQTSALGAQAAIALSDFCAHKDEPPFAVAFEDRLEAFRSRLHGLIASLQAGGK